MSLLAKIRSALDANDELVIGLTERCFQFFSFVVVEIAVAPRIHKETAELQQLLREMLPMQPFRTYDNFDKVEPWRYGTLCFEEEIGSETIARVFTVDDVISAGGKRFKQGIHEAVTQPLRRRIDVQLYPSTNHALARFKFHLAA